MVINKEHQKIILLIAELCCLYMALQMLHGAWDYRTGWFDAMHSAECARSVTYNWVNLTPVLP